VDGTPSVFSIDGSEGTSNSDAALFCHQKKAIWRRTNETNLIFSRSNGDWTRRLGSGSVDFAETTWPILHLCPP
jgi:hypothetical protein